MLHNVVSLYRRTVAFSYIVLANHKSRLCMHPYGAGYDPAPLPSCARDPAGFDAGGCRGDDHHVSPGSGAVGASGGVSRDPDKW